MKTVTITVAPDGSVQSEVKGIKGSSCKDLDKQILKALGTVTDEKRTPEWFQSASQQVRAGQ